MTVIDTSVAMKWFVAGERGHADAVALLDRSDLIAPDLLLIEAASVAWRKARRHELTDQQAARIVAALAGGDLELVPTPPLVPRALELATLLGHPVYDCVYVALAEERNDTVVTADDRLVAAAQRAGLELLTSPVG